MSVEITRKNAKSDGQKWLEMAAVDKMANMDMMPLKMIAALQVTDTDVASKMKANFKAKMKAEIKAERRVARAELQAEIAENKRLIEAAVREEHVRLGANPPLRFYAWI